MTDLIEMMYKCENVCTLECYMCERYIDCILCDIIDTYTGDAPPIINYPIPTYIIYAEGEC